MSFSCYSNITSKFVKQHSQGSWMQRRAHHVVTSSPLEEQEAHPNYSDHHTLCVCVVLETSIGSKLVQS
jgi:hypothetical protein